MAGVQSRDFDSPDETRTPPAGFRRGLLAGPAVALASMAAALMLTAAAGVSLRDPDGVASSRLLVAYALVGVLIVLEAAVRAARRTGRRRPALAEVSAALRERWTLRRLIAVVIALLGFFACYLAYRTAKHDEDAI